MLMSNQHRIHAFIQIMVPVRFDAEDIMQETIMVMWRKFDQFQLGTNFVSWAVKIAHLQIKHFRGKNAAGRLQFCDAIHEKFSDYAGEMHQRVDFHKEALRECLMKLEDGDRDLIEMRYDPDESAKTVARRYGISLKKVYRSVSRIQCVLLRCIRRRLAEESCV